MNWQEFNQVYAMEAHTRSTVDIMFSDNTPLYSASKPEIKEVTLVRVMDRKSFRVVKEYQIHLNYEDVRSVQNQLRELVVQDFKVDEFGATLSETQLVPEEIAAISMGLTG